MDTSVFILQSTDQSLQNKLGFYYVLLILLIKKQLLLKLSLRVATYISVVINIKNSVCTRYSCAGGGDPGVLVIGWYELRPVLGLI